MLHLPAASPGCISHSQIATLRPPVAPWRRPPFRVSDDGLTARLIALSRIRLSSDNAFRPPALAGAGRWLQGDPVKYDPMTGMDAYGNCVLCTVCSCL